MNDFSYLHTNTFEVTIELGCDKFPHASLLHVEWALNREALLLYMEQTHRGLSGFVRDEEGVAIAEAVIRVDDINHDVRTAADGDYWRLLNPGEYQVTALALGFHSASRPCRVGFRVGATRCDFTLQRNARSTGRLQALLRSLGKGGGGGGGGNGGGNGAVLAAAMRRHRQRQYRKRYLMQL
uniref:Inactive carboxypeptidase-like protein X2 n=1 Tax=Petromyzon marinus TaxID=7757 RepID=A0AAJ7SIZ1_PETMA|nr:inactive carboxypeptidase-like protein X2 [Petromyzon marinus]